MTPNTVPGGDGLNIPAGIAISHQPLDPAVKEERVRSYARALRAAVSQLLRHLGADESQIVTSATEGLSIANFDFALVPSLVAEDVLALAEPEFVEEGGNALLIGAEETGKTHLLMAIGAIAAARGKMVRYIGLANHPVESLTQLLDFGETLRGDFVQVSDSECLRRDLIECDLLLIDDLDARIEGLLPLLKARFQAKRSTFIATHGTPADWIKAGVLDPIAFDRFGCHHSLLSPTARSMAELAMGLYIDVSLIEMRPLLDRVLLPDDERRSEMLYRLGLFPIGGIRDNSVFEWLRLREADEDVRDWRILRITEGASHK